MAPSRICTPWPAACSGSGRSAGNRANWAVCSAPSSKASITPTPGFLLAVVDFAEIEHLALHHLAAGAALALDNAPVPMLLAVLETPIRSQIHGETNLHQTILLKRYLVSTTGEFQIPVIEPTRVFLPPGPKLRRQPVPVEKVGLTGNGRSDQLVVTTLTGPCLPRTSTTTCRSDRRSAMSAMLPETARPLRTIVSRNAGRTGSEKVIRGPAGSKVRPRQDWM